jgi:hypothetical protein
MTHSDTLWPSIAALQKARFAERKLMEYRTATIPPDHSGLMPANFTTLAHFSVSSTRNLPNSAGVSAALATTGSLRTERRERATQWLAGYHHEARERLTQFEDQEDRSRRRKRKNA